MRNCFHKYEDPYHGWLKVRRVELYSLGLREVISKRSYQRDGDVYLEEDVDAVKFTEAYKRKFDRPIRRVVHRVRQLSIFRTYKPYDPAGTEVKPRKNKMARSRAFNPF
jgi:hypothetical protein